MQDSALGNKKLRGALILVLFVLVILAAVWSFYRTNFIMHVTKIEPNTKTLARNGIIAITFNKEIANVAEITKNLSTNPEHLIAVTVNNNGINISPIGLYEPDKEYSFNIPTIRAKSGQTAKAQTIKFKVENTIANDDEINPEDIEVYTFEKYPFLKDLVNSSSIDFTVTYGYPNDVFTLYADIQPYVPPQARNTSAYDDKVVEVYRGIIDTIKKYNIDPKSFPIIVTPEKSKQIVELRGDIN